MIVKRRTFLKHLGLGSTCLGVASLPLSASPVFASSQKLRWRMALAIPRTLPIWGEGMDRFVKLIEQLSGGNFKIRLYGAGELVPALGTFDAVKKGELQMGHSAAYYWQGKVPAAPFFTAIPFGLQLKDALAWMKSGGGQKLYDELMNPHGVQCFPCGATNQQPSGWFKKELKSTADLKGLKIRIPGLAAKIYSRLGAEPVLIPGGEVYTSLSTGVIDAVEWIGPYHDYLMGFHRSAKYYYGSAWAEPGSMLELMIHKPSWDSLPEEYKSLIKLASEDTTNWMVAEFEKRCLTYLEKIYAEKSIHVAPLPSSILNAIQHEAGPVIKEMVDSSPIAKKIWQSYSKFQKDTVEYYELMKIPQKPLEL